jgi:hypothetical protein
MGLVVLGAGLALGAPIIALAGTILIAHAGMDRSVGYGLKLMSGFHDTHLGRKGGKADTADAGESSETAHRVVVAS